MDHASQRLPSPTSSTARLTLTSPSSRVPTGSPCVPLLPFGRRCTVSPAPTASQTAGRPPLTTAQIRRLAGVCDDDLAGPRDRTLLLIGFAGVLRRSE